MEMLRSYLKTYAGAIIVFAILLIIGIFYIAGFRVGPGGIARVGTLTLTNLPSGTSVYVEQTLRGAAKKSGDLSFELFPGNHSVIVAAPNSYPWSAVIKVESGQEKRVNPFLLGTKVAVARLTGPEATSAIQAVHTASLPSAQKPLSLNNNCVQIYVTDNQVIEDAATSTPGCTPPPYLCIGGTCAPTIILAPIAPITGVFPFPGRQDALAVSFAGSLYAIGVDPTSPQFFAPLIRGTDPKFGALPDGTIVVQDGSIVSALKL